MNRKKKHTRLESYQRNAAGEYVYIGDYMTYVDQTMPRRRLLAVLWTLGCVAAACLLAGGFLPVESFTGCGYVLIPYMLALLGNVAVLWHLGELTGGGEPIKVYVYEATVLRIPYLAMLSALVAALCVLGQIIRCAIKGSCTRAEILFLLLELLGAVVLLLLRRILGRAKWSIQEK